MIQSKTTFTTSIRAAMGFMAAAIAAPVAMAGPLSDDGSSADFEVGSPEGGWRDWFSVTLNPSVRYDDNIFNTPENEESDIIAVLALTLAVANSEDANNQWLLSYTPSARFYDDNNDLDGEDHAAFASYARVMGKTTLETSAFYTESTGSNRFASGFINSIMQGVTAGVKHQLSGKTRLDASYKYDDFEYSDGALTDYSQHSAKVAALYGITGKLDLGPYLSYQDADVVGGRDHEAVGVGITAEYGLTGKTTLNGFLGYENRTFSGGGTSDRDALAFEFGATHQYTDKTRFEASIYQRSQPSPSSAQDGYEALGASLTGSHQLTDKLGFYSTLAYEMTDYYSTLAGGTAVTRNAGFLTLEVGSSYALTENLLLGGSLKYADNDSDSAAATYDNLQAILNASYTF